MPVYPRAGTFTLDVEQVGQITVVRVLCRPLARGEHEEPLGTALQRLLEDPRYRLVVLNLGELHLLGSALLGDLLTFRRGILVVGGRLALCAVSEAIQEGLEVMKLSRLFSVYENEEGARQALEPAE
jgi:anti-anti-sigma factor